jgi:ATP synthase F1 complex assembly factor 1
MHFEDLSHDKGVVLMRAEIDPSQTLIGSDDARILVMGLQKFYGGEAESERGRIRRKLVQEFTSGSESFDVNALIDELSRIE